MSHYYNTFLYFVPPKSGGSVESPHLTDYGSSSEDVQHGESRLREDLADAMLETAANSSGKNFIFKIIF